MKINKKDILSALQNQKNGGSAKLDHTFEKTDFLKKIGNFMPTPDGKGQLLNDSRKALNTDLANPDSKIKFENVWKLQQSDMKDISRKLLVESAILENSQPNAFRLDLGSLVLDKTHAKLGMTRAGEAVHIELMYPNSNDKITVKLSVDGVDDNIYELALEDEAYIGNFGASILTQIDEMIQSKEGMGLGDYDSEYYIGNKSSGMTDMGPNWVAGGGLGESTDAARMKDLMVLVEGEDDGDDDEDDLGLDDAGEDGGEFNNEGEDELDGDAADVNSEEFGADDFSMEGGGDMDFGSDVDMSGFDDIGGGGGGGIGGIGGDIGGGDGGEEGVNDTGDEFSTEEDVNYMTFREKSDWLISSLDAMQKLVSTNVASKMQDGEGVLLTSDEILNGSTGIKNDANSEIIDKFLKVYPSIDTIELKEEDLDRIEEKLSLDDGQFDSWLQSELPGMRGDSDVSDTLDNEMFDEFDEMGGEKEQKSDGLGEFDEFIDDTTSDDGKIDDMFSEISDATEEEDDDIFSEISEADDDDNDDALRREVENEVDGKKLDEFPNT